MDQQKRKIDEYGPQDMAIPELKLLQNTGGDYAKSQGANPGQFYNNLSDEILDEVNIIVVDIPSGRARWGQEITNAGPICASLDAKSNKSIYGEDCNKCEHRVEAPWSIEASERRKACCLNYTILGIDLDHDYMPTIIRAHGVSALPTRQLVTQLRMNRALKGEYHRAVVNIKSVEKTTAYGPTFALHPKIIELLTDEVKVEELRIASQNLLGTPIPLPEIRPEDEGDPLGFTSDGTPFYSEEEKEVLALKVTKGKEPDASSKVESTGEDKTVASVEVKPEEKRKEGKEKGKLDLDF